MLNEGRYGHACAQYVDDNGIAKNIVAGGWNGKELLDSSESNNNDGEWSLISPLPLKIEFLKAATLDNEIFVMGKLGVD